jgi:glycerophosphoryl diester phosphodiesterase
MPQSGGVRPRYGHDRGPLAIAHRGGAGLAAENTLDAFGRSYALGLRYLETDIRVTRDRDVVAFHDRTLHRVTGVRSNVSALDSRHLTTLPVLGREPIPTLREALLAFPQARFTVDVKEREALPRLVEVLIETGAAARVCLAGAWDSWLAHAVEQVGPDLTVAMGWRMLSRTLTALRYGRHPRRLPTPGSFAHVPLRLGRIAIFHDELVPRAHDLGVRIVVWTVNEPQTMHRLLDRGVDGIITDRPDLLREVLIARDQWHPPADEIDPLDSDQRGVASDA